MKFKEGKLYICIHDVLINNKLAFKSDNCYKCIKDNILIGTNNDEFKLSLINSKWEFYFKEYSGSIASVAQFKGIVDKMINLYEIKNKDYGNSFEQSCDDFGITAGLVRMSDKFNRIKTLAKQDNLVKDESIEDTLIDLANYSIMTLIWYKNNKK